MDLKAIPTKVISEGVYELLSVLFQGAEKLFVLAYDATNGNEAGIKYNKKYFLPREKIKDYNIRIYWRNFYDQPINNLIKQHDELKTVPVRQGDSYTIGCLLDCTYFKDNYRLIAVDISN